MARSVLERIAKQEASSPREAAGSPRKWTNRLILKSLLIAALSVDGVLALVLIYMVFLQVPYFNLRTVDVIGNSHLSADEVVEGAEVEGGTNLLTVNLNSIAKRLKRNPWIRTASVYRRFPGRLIIEIQERTPRAILCAGRLYYVDEEGEAFTRVLPGHSVKYPLFTGIDPAQLRKRAADVNESLRVGLSLLDIVERDNSGIIPAALAEVRISLDHGFSLVTKGGQTVVMGSGDFENKLNRYARLKRHLTRRGKWNNARIIDLDFEDRALVRTVGGQSQG